MSHHACVPILAKSGRLIINQAWHAIYRAGLMSDLCIASQIMSIYIVVPARSHALSVAPLGFFVPRHDQSSIHTWLTSLHF